MGEYKCKKCKKDFNSYDALRRHVNRIHKIDSYSFYVEYYLNGIWPTCQCGCGKKVLWSRELRGFRNYSAGHQSRIKNNWGHNKEALKRSAETRRQKYASGEIEVWNEGLTKKTDERLKNQGLSISRSFSNERKIQYSKIMKNNRLNGTIPTLYGSDSSQWKGGISEINNIARSDKRLYDEWKYPILSRDDFKCVECGNGDNLHIHHDKETMCEIVKKHVVDKGIVMDFELKKCIASKVVDYHIQNKVSGKTLCPKCHNKLHPSLNFN